MVGKEARGVGCEAEELVELRPPTSALPASREGSTWDGELRKDGARAGK